MVNKSVSFRLSQEELDKLNKVAESMGYYYAKKPCFTKVLREIAKGNLIISKKIT